MRGGDLSLADHVCLALVAEEPRHGWAIVKLLAPDGDVGHVWALSRPLTYRAITRLQDGGLVRKLDTGRRQELRVTAAGRRETDEWLAAPVAHLRDLRTEFLVKTRLLERRGGTTAELARRQLVMLAPVIDALTAATVDASTTPVDLWRQESARAAERFLQALAAAPDLGGRRTA